jgi:uncharacterized OsmC-like protein
MTMSDIEIFEKRQSALKQAYRDDPALGKQMTVVRSVTGEDLAPGKVSITVEGESGFTIEVGAHHSVGGTPDLACSGDLFLASYAACYELTLRLVAQAMNIPLRNLDLRVEGDWDARGTLAIDREAPVGYTAIRISVAAETDASEEQVARLLKSAERYCVVGATLKQPPVVEIETRITA